MKQNTNKIYVPKLFKKANVKKLILILYCVVPLLVVSIGFASWLIVGADSSSTASGTFYASDIINSYDYIEPEDNGTQTINMYPTSFVDSNGNFVTTVKIDVKFKLNLTACYDLTQKEGNNKTLYAIFNLGFSSGKAFDTFFRKLTPTVQIGGTAIADTATTLGTQITGSQIKMSSNNVTTNSEGEAIGRTTTIEINLENASKNGDKNKDVFDLVITYTLDPTDTENSSTAGKYQNIYENVVNYLNNNKLTFMMDVTINDYSGNDTQN